MNGERRIRLSERFTSPPGDALPDCLIAARIAQTVSALYQADNNQKMAERFSGFDWKTPEDAFNDGFRRAGQPGAGSIDSQGGPTGHLVTYELLRKAGNNGVQLPVQSVAEGQMKGTEMLYADGHFDTPNGKARFFPSAWNGFLKAAEDQKQKHKFWINNGRLNEVWQSAYNNQYDSFVSRRVPMAMLQMNPLDMRALGVSPSDVVEIHNDFGATLAMAYPADQLKPTHTFLLFGYVNGVAGDVTTTATDPHFVPYYKGAWASIKRVGSVPEFERTVSTKSRYYSV
jgi:arsenite oxidase large subunit